MNKLKCVAMIARMRSFLADHPDGKVTPDNLDEFIERVVPKQYRTRCRSALSAMLAGDTAKAQLELMSVLPDEILDVFDSEKAEDLMALASACNLNGGSYVKESSV